MGDRQSGGKRPSKVNAARAERQRQALELRVAGHNFAEIAERVGYANESGAWKAVQRALVETQRPAADELRTLLSMRYETLIVAAWPKVLAGDIPAINAVRRVIDSLARLHLPVRFEGTITQQTETDEAINELVAELDRRSAAAANASRTILATEIP